MQDMKAGTRTEAALGSTIRRELGSKANRTFLSRMPGFKPDPVIPERLVALLAALERAEALSGSGTD